MARNERDSPFLKPPVVLVGGFIVIIWAVEIVDWLSQAAGVSFLPHPLDYYGVRPRQIDGLWGLLWWPFLHNGFGHLISNTAPLIVLGGMVAFRKIGHFLLATLCAMAVGGLGIWAFGAANSVHIGASGVVFGYFGFLVGRALFERTFLSVLIAIVVIVLYGGLIHGVLPQSVQENISWLGHLFGMLGGVLASWLVSKDGRSRAR